MENFRSTDDVLRELAVSDRIDSIFKKRKSLDAEIRKEFNSLIYEYGFTFNRSPITGYRFLLKNMVICGLQPLDVEEFTIFLLYFSCCLIDECFLCVSVDFVHEYFLRCPYLYANINLMYNLLDDLDIPLPDRKKWDIYV